MGQKLTRENAPRMAAAMPPGPYRDRVLQYAAGGSYPKVIDGPGLTFKALGQAAGGLLKTGLPALVPGVGPVLAAGLGTAGSVLSGGNMQDHLRAGGTSLALGAGKKLLAGAGNVPGADKLSDLYAVGKSKVGGFVERAREGLPDLPDGFDLPNLPDMPENPFELPDANGGFGGLVRKGVDWAKDNPDAILGGLSAAQGIRERSQAGAARERAMAGLAEPQREDLSFMQDQGNPYARAPAPKQRALPSALPKAGGGFAQLARRGA